MTEPKRNPRLPKPPLPRYDGPLTGGIPIVRPGINDQRNTQHYRYEWVEDQIKNAKENARREIKSIRASFQAGEITRSQAKDKQIQVAEHRNMIKRRMNHIKEQGYDVPWYIDAANLGGLLSGDMHRVAKDRRTIWAEYND